MNKIEYLSAGFANTEVQKTEVEQWRQVYDGLILGLGSLGTEVKVARTLETDQDIAPYRFVRAAVHEFIFPPQRGEKTDKSAPVDSSLGYNLYYQDITQAYDPSQVQGKIEVRYDDADSRINFSVTDGMEGDSRLDGQVLAILSTLEHTISAANQTSGSPA